MARHEVLHIFHMALGHSARFMESDEMTTLNEDMQEIRDYLKGTLYSERFVRIESVLRDAQRYAFLRGRDLETINRGGIFAGKTPDNMILNGKDLDDAIDAAISKINTETCA